MMRRPFAIAALALLFVLVPSIVTAQAAVPTSGRFESWSAPPLAGESQRDSRRGPLGDGSKDHRYLGFYIGAATGLVIGIASFGLCGDYLDDSGDTGCPTLTYLAVPLVSTALFGALGALIGGAFDK